MDWVPNNDPNGPGDAANEARETGGERNERPNVKVARYGAMGWIGEFGHKPGLIVRAADHLVLQTDRGMELGEPIGTPCTQCDLVVPREALQAYVKTSGTEFCRPRVGRIMRVATEADVNEQAHLNAHINDDVAYCAQCAHDLDLDMKIITAEHLLGGERIVFYFAAPARVDFRQLVKQLAQRYRTRIEMRQVGARDEARLVADYEVCGRECCCRNFLKKLRPVNMKMAKLQKSTLDPSKVSGRCGRLRCCLRYEHEGYETLVRTLPRLNSYVETEFGIGQVIDRQVLTQLASVRFEDNRVIAIPVEEIKAFNVKPPEPKPEPERPPRTERKPAPTKPPPPNQPEPAAPADDTAQESTDQSPPRGRRRRRRRKDSTSDDRRRRESNPDRDTSDNQTDAASSDASEQDADSRKRASRRRRRGGRRRPRRRDSDSSSAS